MLKMDAITCSNCDRLLCRIYYHENGKCLQVVCNCPYCGDASFPLKINSDQCSPKVVEDLIVEDIDFNVAKNRMKVYVNRKKV